MTSNPEVRKVTFTGSTEVGRLLSAAVVGTRSRSSRWNSAATRPFIVFDDADLDAAVGGAIVSESTATRARPRVSRQPALRPGRCLRGLRRDAGGRGGQTQSRERL